MVPVGYRGLYLQPVHDRFIHFGTAHGCVPDEPPSNQIGSGIAPERDPLRALHAFYIVNFPRFQCFDLLVGRQEGHPACGYLSGSRCRFDIAQLMPLPLLSLAPVNPDWLYLPAFIFLVLALPASPGHSPGAVKRLLL